MLKPTQLLLFVLSSCGSNGAREIFDGDNEVSGQFDVAICADE